ncbi:hypothetical protein [Nocardioides sp. BYT-33-1]|uniref:hypothetical protein n=1 Tax=Nocardioides sp. BYT-33-1 TaxID=3416952 RepID=UPI003F53A753
MTEQQQPEATERVEWASIYDFRAHPTREAAERVQSRFGGEIYRRTVTTYAPVVGPWEPIEEEQP